MSFVFSGDSGNEISRIDIIDLRLQLDRERRLRMHLEEKLRSIESQMYPSDRLREMAHVQLTYQSHDVSILKLVKGFIKFILFNFDGFFN